MEHFFFVSIERPFLSTNITWGINFSINLIKYFTSLNTRKPDKFIIKRRLAYVKNKEAQLKDEYIQSSVETTEKSKRDALNQKYK